MQPSNSQIKEAYRECAKITRAASTNFYIGFLTLPRELRNAVYATYAFCRLCDDIVDDPVPGVDPKRALNAVEDALHGASQTESADSPIFVALNDAVQRFGLEKGYYLEVIDGCRMDIDVNHYETFEDLRVYCRRVASAVGKIMISILGYTDETALQYADDLGIAFQMTNILRDIREDYANQRVYIPQDELRMFGLDESVFASETASDGFQKMVEFQVDRARTHYERGTRVIEMTESGRECLELMTGFYFRILENIDRNHADILSRRVSLSGRDKISVIGGVGWRWAKRSVRR